MFDWNRQSVGEDMLTKSDPDMERVARKYVEDMMGEPCGDNLFEDLKDGKVLCALVNKIQPGIVKKVNTMNIAAMQMENISFFLDALLEVPPLSFPSSAHAYTRPTAAAKPADPVAPIYVRPCSSGSSKRVASGPPISGMVRYANTCTAPANSCPLWRSQLCRIREITQTCAAPTVGITVGKNELQICLCLRRLQDHCPI